MTMLADRLAQAHVVADRRPLYARLIHMGLWLSSLWVLIFTRRYAMPVHDESLTQAFDVPITWIILKTSVAPLAVPA